MGKKRIVVTGMGVVSCYGTQVSQFYQSLLDGQSGIAPIQGFPVDDYPTRFAGEVKEFSTEGYLEKKQARRIDPYIAYGMVAGKKAVEDAGLPYNTFSEEQKKRCGVIVGTGMGGMQIYSSQVVTLHEKGQRRVSPFFVPYTIGNMAAGMLAMDLGFMGPNYAISTACATGNHCLVAAANHIRMGHGDVMIAGGVEAAIQQIGLAGFCSIKALSTRNEAPEQASRPWDKGRDGFVMGEGGAVLVLESLEHAEKRGAKIYAEYCGGAVSCDAYHLTDPQPDGLGVAYCIEQALLDGEMKAEEINYINAHATSTQVGDRAEIQAIKKVVPTPSAVTMNATKSLTGHCLGAAGALEAIASVMAIHTGKVHPTLNLEDPEDWVKDFLIPTKATSLEITGCLSNSFGFGGHNAAVLFRPYRSGE